MQESANPTGFSSDQNISHEMPLVLEVDREAALKRLFDTARKYGVSSPEKVLSRIKNTGPLLTLKSLGVKDDGDGEETFGIRRPDGIYIDVDAVKRLAEAAGANTEDIYSHVLLHEAVHDLAYSDTGRAEKIEGFDEFEPRVQRNGIRDSHISLTGDQKKGYELLNEGMIEHLVSQATEGRSPLRGTKQLYNPELKMAQRILEMIGEEACYKAMFTKDGLVELRTEFDGKYRPHAGNRISEYEAVLTKTAGIMGKESKGRAVGFNFEKTHLFLDQLEGKAPLNPPKSPFRERFFGFFRTPKS